MIDLNNLNKAFFEKANGIIEPSKIQMEDIDNYAGVIDIENVFDKNIRINGAKELDGWGEIPNYEELNESEDGLVWMGGRQYYPNYICYAYKIINFKEDTIIGYQIYCLNEIFKLDKPYYKSFEELKKNLEKHLHLDGDWSTEYFHHNIQNIYR